MSYSPPTPPAELTSDVITMLNDSSAEELRHIAEYAEALADHKEREARLEDNGDDNQTEERPEDLPDEVPLKATITIKEINDNRYYYWQWREGEKIKSKYKGPVNPNE